MTKWYVSLENRVGQVTVNEFESRGVFNRLYSPEIFPIIHYCGPNQRRCREVTTEAMIPRVMNLDVLSTWTLAEVDLAAAVERYNKLKDAGIISK